MKIVKASCLLLFRLHFV